ncbi:MAG: hypothetical protein ACKOCH_24630, partial [Bacteroidota bacterium]
MKAPATLTIEYMPCDHLSQLYHGLHELAAKNIISLRLQPVDSPNGLKPVIRAWLQSAGHRDIRLVYDTLDGLNWVDDLTESENLRYFQDNFEADFYFKRSFSHRLIEFSPKNCTVLPLGL